MSEIVKALLPKPETQKEIELNSALQLFINNTIKILDRGINFEDNIDCDIITHEFTAVDTEETISHALGKVPNYYLIVNLSTNAVIYNGGTAFTNSNIYLKSSALCTVKLIVS